MRKTFEQLLAYLLSVTLLMSTTVYAAPGVDNPNIPVMGALDFSKELSEADDFNRQYADLEKAGEGQPRSSLAPDRFLMMEQTVLPKEIPVVRTFVGHQFRTWRLNALVKKAEKYLTQSDLVTEQAELATRSKAWLKDFAWLTLARAKEEAGGKPYINSQTVKEVEAITDIQALANEIFKQLSQVPAVTKEQRQAILELKTAEERLQKMNEIMVRASIMDHLAEGRRADTPLFMWERQKSKPDMEVILAELKARKNQWEWNDRNKVLNVTEAPTERQARHINWWDTSIQVQDGDRVIKTLRMTDTAVGRNTSNEQPFFCATNGSCRFNITKGDLALHVYGIQAQVVATYDQYVVFTHADSYDSATGTQYLHFLDLGTYNGLIGNEEIPVFRVPLKIDEPIQSLTMNKGNLVLNNKFTVEKSTFAQASDWQQVAFNLQGNLTNPDSWAKVLPLVDEVQTYFQQSVDQEFKSKADENEGLRRATVLMPQLAKELEKTLKTQKAMKPLTAEEHAQLGQKIAQAADGEKEAAARLDLYHQRVGQSADLANIMSQTQERAHISRKLGARVRLLGASLLSPRPNTSQKIKEALGAWFVHHPDSKGNLPTREKIMDKVLALTDRPYVNGGVIAAGIMAATMPDTFAVMMHSGLSVSTAILDYLMGMLSGVGEATAEGTKSTFAGVTTFTAIPEQYFWDNNYARTAVGLSAFATFLGSLYFIPHLIFNYKALKKDMGGNVFKSGGMEAFRQRQAQFRQAYFNRLAQDEGAHRDIKKVEFTDEQEAEIQAFLKQRYEEIGNRRRFFGLLGAKQDSEVTIGAALESQSEAVEKALEAASTSTAIAKAEKDTPEQFKDFWSALKHFAFSMPALELTLENWAKKWNTWAGWRFTTVGFGYVNILGSDIPLYIKVKPVSFAARVLYPEFLRRSIYTRKGKVAIPTELNGGLRKRLSNWFTFNSSPTNIDPKLQLAALKRFEEQIIAAEDQINEVAFRQALESLPKFMKSKDDLRKLFNAKSLDTITQKEILDLSWESKTYLRAHFESIYKVAMEKFMNETLLERETIANAVEASSDDRVDTGFFSDDSAKPTLTVEEAPQIANPNGQDFDREQENAQRSLKAMKKLLVAMQAPNGEKADYSFDVERAKAAALSVADDPVHNKNAEEAVAAGRMSPSNFGLNARYNLVSDMDPSQNRSMARLEVVHRRLQSPGALARAVRAEISKLRYTLWVDLSFKLMLAAGITSGSMKPIHDQLFSADSIFYLSSTSFYMMMASGFMMSLMADAWLKLQQDARQDEMGEFGAIPRGEDAQRSFFGWYRKQFSANENSLVKNWGLSNQISFWNLPAALTNITLFNFMFSGRIDLSLLFAGYSLVFTTPLSALHYKVDQAFERAAHFAARGVKDEKWLAHPDVQKLLVPETQRLRDRFTLFNDIYGNVQGNLIGNIEMVPTNLGPRGFQRALFGGGLLEEYIVTKALDPLSNAVTGVPVLEHIVKPIVRGCEALLTFRNGDLRIPGR